MKAAMSDFTSEPGPTHPGRAVLVVLNCWFVNQCDHIGDRDPELMRAVSDQYDLARHALADLDPSV